MSNKLSFVLDNVFFTKSDAKIRDNESSFDYVKRTIESIREIHSSKLSMILFQQENLVSYAYELPQKAGSSFENIFQTNMEDLNKLSVTPEFVRMHVQNENSNTPYSEGDIFKFHPEFYNILPINSEEKIKQYLDFVINTLNINFHPDDDFTDYIVNIGCLIDFEENSLDFSKNMCDFMNNLTNTCFEIAGDKVYEWGFEIQQAKLGKIGINLGGDIVDEQTTDLSSEAFQSRSAKNIAKVIYNEYVKENENPIENLLDEETLKASVDWYEENYGFFNIEITNEKELVTEAMRELVAEKLQQIPISKEDYVFIEAGKYTGDIVKIIAIGEKETGVDSGYKYINSDGEKGICFRTDILRASNQRSAKIKFEQKSPVEVIPESGLKFDEEIYPSYRFFNIQLITHYLGNQNTYSGSADWGGIPVWSVSGPNKFVGTFIIIDDNDEIILLERLFNEDTEENEDTELAKFGESDTDGIEEMLKEIKYRKTYLGLSFDKTGIEEKSEVEKIADFLVEAYHNGSVEYKYSDLLDKALRLKQIYYYDEGKSDKMADSTIVEISNKMLDIVKNKTEEPEKSWEELGIEQQNQQKPSIIIPEELAQLFMNFCSSYSNLTGAWFEFSDDEKLMDILNASYPFTESFNEIPIIGWVDAIVKRSPLKTERYSSPYGKASVETYLENFRNDFDKIVEWFEDNQFESNIEMLCVTNPEIYPFNSSLTDVQNDIFEWTNVAISKLEKSVESMQTFLGMSDEAKARDTEESDIEYIRDNQRKKLVQEIKQYVSGNSWFTDDSEEGELDELMFISRQYGNVGDETPGAQDITRAGKLCLELKDKFPGVKAGWDTTDEWTNLHVIIEQEETPVVVEETPVVVEETPEEWKARKNAEHKIEANEKLAIFLSKLKNPTNVELVESKEYAKDQRERFDKIFDKRDDRSAKGNAHFGKIKQVQNLYEILGYNQTLWAKLIKDVLSNDFYWDTIQTEVLESHFENERKGYVGMYSGDLTGQSVGCVEIDGTMYYRTFPYSADTSGFF